MSDRYTAAWVVPAEGARLGIVTCKECGAALALDRDIDVMQLHDEFHATLEGRWDDYCEHERQG